eukprot:g5847.t1
MVAKGSMKTEENVQLDAAKSKESTPLTEEKLYASDIFRMFCYKVRFLRPQSPTPRLKRPFYELVSSPSVLAASDDFGSVSDETRTPRGLLDGVVGRLADTLCVRRASRSIHLGEKAGRRDPQKYRYVGIECHEAKEGAECPRGNDCPYAHNLFEFWLHPTRYRTQLCNKPATCRRKVCFFAHNVEELRQPSENYSSVLERMSQNNGSDTNCSSSSDSEIESANSSVLDSEKDGRFLQQVSPLSTLDLESNLVHNQSASFPEGSLDASSVVLGALSADFSTSSRASSRCSPVPFKIPGVKFHCSPSVLAPGGEHTLQNVSSVQIPAYRCNSSENGMSSDLSVPLDFPLETHFPTLSGSFMEEVSDKELSLFRQQQFLSLADEHKSRA